jgi:tripartite ATP-independent transporter DctM subunit
VTVRLKPEWAPPGPRGSMRERVRAILAMWKLVLLFGIAVGGIYAGWFSPTEAAGIASFVAIVIAAATRQLTWRGFYECVMETLRTTGMLMFIIVGAWIFAYFVVQTRLPVGLINLIRHFDLAPWAVILLILVFYVILGCVLDAVAIILVTVPVFLPVATALGYDSVWYGILMVVVVEIGLITPPVGLNIFVMRAQLPDIPLTTMFAGIAPFLVADAILIGLLMIFPQIALWLPGLLF